MPRFAASLSMMFGELPLPGLEGVEATFDGTVLPAYSTSIV